MVNRRISNDLKDCALRLWDHGWDLEDICEAFGVSERSCYRWRRIFEECGTATKPPSPLTGRTRTITRALLMAVEDLFAEDSDLFLDEVCTWLAIEHDIIVSTSTLSRNLKDAGLT
ncbi:Homeodomain-like protein, partial [Suillus brevipes Sb2]